MVFYRESGTSFPKIILGNFAPLGERMNRDPAQ